MSEEICQVCKQPIKGEKIQTERGPVHKGTCEQYLHEQQGNVEQTQLLMG